jgi:hypothetical protein
MCVPPSTCALCAPERRVGATPGRPCWPVGRASRPPVGVGQAARRVSQAKHFSVVAGPQQAEGALCVWDELGFGPEAV